VLCSLLWVTLLGQGGGLPTPTMLGFWDSVMFPVICVGIRAGIFRELLLP